MNPDTDIANQTAVAAMLAARPMLTDIRPAGEVISDLKKGTLLHAGPPVTWENMVDVQRGAAIGALLYEGWANSPAEATVLAASGEVRLRPCNDVRAVGGLAGVISPSMPVAVAANATRSQVAYSRLWEPKLLFGSSDVATMISLRWLERVAAPLLAAAVRRAGGIDLFGLIGKALHMGDECHSRHTAGSSLFLRALLPYLVRVEATSSDLASTLEFLAANDAVFLPFVMAAAKVITLAGSGVPGSSIVTTVCTNGYQAGIQLSGTGDRWFIGPAPVVDGVLLPGFTAADASPQIGDSGIVEVVGLGACAMAAAPEAPANTGNRLEMALALTQETLKIAKARQPGWTIPALNYAGVPCGLDARKIVKTGILPPSSATIPSRKAGGGRIGMGIARPPLLAFQAALAVLDRSE